MSSKSDLQKCQGSVSSKSVPARGSRKRGKAECPTRVSSKSGSQECCAIVSSKGVPQLCQCVLSVSLNIRVSIRVRGFHVVFFLGLGNFGFRFGNVFL